MKYIKLFEDTSKLYKSIAFEKGESLIRRMVPIADYDWDKIRQYMIDEYYWRRKFLPIAIRIRRRNPRKHSFHQLVLILKIYPIADEYFILRTHLENSTEISNTYQCDGMDGVLQLIEDIKSSRSLP
jgi:hypothetical protein